MDLSNSNCDMTYDDDVLFSKTNFNFDVRNFIHKKHILDTVVQMIPNAKVNSFKQHIKQAINMYHQEILNVCKINQNVDTLNRKQKNMYHYINDFKVSLQEFKQFVNKFLPSDDILYDIDTIHANVVKLQHQIDAYVSKKYKQIYVSYKKSCAILASLQDVLTLIKFNKHICPICFHKEISAFTVPCGHVYCEDCCALLTVSCFICRGNIYKVQALYYN
jgi:hypothetical protein